MQNGYDFLGSVRLFGGPIRRRFFERHKAFRQIVRLDDRRLDRLITFLVGGEIVALGGHIERCGMTEDLNRPRASDTPLHAEVRDRFGVVPNFFRLASEAPEITANLWGFAKFGYLDNPLPSLFKERLFVYLSRFCEVRYCIARHVGFLVGLGRPSGDRHCPPETVEQVRSADPPPAAAGR